MIRTANIGDAESICAIAEQTWWAAQVATADKQNLQLRVNEIYALDIITRQIETRTADYLLLVEDGLAVGFASYGRRPDHPDIYKLHKLYCLPKTQGKGYVKILILEVINKVAGLGGNRLDLDIKPLNQTRNFYEKMGFRQDIGEDGKQQSEAGELMMYLHF